MYEGMWKHLCDFYSIFNMQQWQNEEIKAQQEINRQTKTRRKPIITMFRAKRQNDDRKCRLYKKKSNVLSLSLCPKSYGTAHSEFSIEFDYSKFCTKISQ